MRWKRPIVIVVIAVVCLGGIIALDQFSPFAYVSTRNMVRDAITRAGRTTPPNPDLVFLAIDAEAMSSEAADEIDEIYGVTDRESIEARALHMMKRQWPWSREVYALITERLVEAGAKVVLFDLTFPTPLAGDEAFRAALDKYRDRVVIGSNFVSADKAEGAGKLIADTPPAETLVAPTQPRDDRVAYTNFWPDEDDVVRRAQYQVTVEEVNGAAATDGSERLLSMAARGLSKAGFADRLPTDTVDRLFRYTAPPREGFRPRSVIGIFDPHSWTHAYKSGEFFRDKIVLIGAEGNWQHDVHPTPFGSMPGPEIHLNAMNAAIHGEFIQTMSHTGVTLVALAATVISVLMSLGIRSPWLRLLALVAANCLIVAAALFAYNRLALYISCLLPLVQTNSTVLLGLVCDFTWERLEKTRVRQTLERYVSTNVVRELLDRPAAFEQSLGGVLKPATVLFSDIRGYSSVTARTDPQALVAQLNEYLSAMVECVFRYGGTLDKFIGDAVMAVWGNVRSDGVANDAANAVRAALEMRTELERLNRDWQKRGLPELRIGIAINQGDVVVGNIGSPRRMEFTVIGDAVNVSWKLQELTKQVETDLIVSKSVAALVVEHFDLQRLGEFEMRGFSGLFEIFAVSRPIKVSAQPDLEAFEIR